MRVHHWCKLSATQCFGDDQGAVRHEQDTMTQELPSQGGTMSSSSCTTSSSTRCRAATTRRPHRGRPGDLRAPSDRRVRVRGAGADLRQRLMVMPQASATVISSGSPTASTSTRSGTSGSGREPIVSATQSSTCERASRRPERSSSVHAAVLVRDRTVDPSSPWNTTAPDPSRRSPTRMRRSAEAAHSLGPVPRRARDGRCDRRARQHLDRVCAWCDHGANDRGRRMAAAPRRLPGHGPRDDRHVLEPRHLLALRLGPPRRRRCEPRLDRGVRPGPSGRRRDRSDPSTAHRSALHHHRHRPRLRRCRPHERHLHRPREPWHASGRQGRATRRRSPDWLQHTNELGAHKGHSAHRCTARSGRSPSRSSVRFIGLSPQTPALPLTSDRGHRFVVQPSAGSQPITRRRRLPRREGGHRDAGIHNLPVRGSGAVRPLKYRSGLHNAARENDVHLASNGHP